MSLRSSGLLLPDYCGLSPAELLAHRRAGGGRGAVVLVPEYDAAFFQIVGRHFHDDAIARQGLDAVLFHLAGRVGDDLVPGIEFDAVTGVRQDFGDEALEFNQLFLRHGSSLGWFTWSVHLGRSTMRC